MAAFMLLEGGEEELEEGCPPGWTAEGPENDLAFEFGVVGLLIPLGPYRGKVGDWGGSANELGPPPPDDDGEDLSPSRVNCGFWACVFGGDPTTML